MGLINSPARVQRMTPDQYDLRARQGGINDPAIKIILKCLIDEATVRRHAECRNRIDMAYADIRYIEPVRGRLRRAAKLDGKCTRFPGRSHRAMAGDDPLDECRPGARQADDKNRISSAKTGRTGREPCSGLRANDPVDLADFGPAVVAYRTSLQIGACHDMIERARVLTEILTFLAQRKTQHDLAAPSELPFADQRLHLGDVIAVRGLDAQVGAQIMGEDVMAVERDRGVAMRFRDLEHPRHPLRERYCETPGRAVTARRNSSAARLWTPSRPKMAPSPSRASGEEPRIFEAASAALRASPVSPEKKRHLARRIWAIGSLGVS